MEPDIGSEWVARSTRWGAGVVGARVWCSQSHGVEMSSEGEVMDGVHSALGSTMPRQLPPELTAFISLRFGSHGVDGMAQELQAALAQGGVDGRIIDMQAGTCLSSHHPCQTAVSQDTPHVVGLIPYRWQHSQGGISGARVCEYLHRTRFQALWGRNRQLG